MFEAGTNGAELGTAVFDHAVTTSTPTTTTRDRELHARLVAIRRARVALEAEELRCLLEVEATELYRRRGYASLREYMERELHYGPHAANERLRVARELGDLDTDDRSRPTPTIPAAIRRKIWHRDAGRCVVPGCRSSANLDVHHLRFRSHGGSHTVANGCLLCGAHHQHLHDQRLRITGRAPALTVEWLREDRDGAPIWVDDPQAPPPSHVGSGARGATARRRPPPSRPEAASGAG